MSLAATAVDGATAAQSAAIAPFAFNFLGAPAAPQPWHPSNWDVVVNSRDRATFAQLQPMAAQHGADCSPYPATHTTSSYEGAVFICRNHLMTAINAGGYGEIVLTPDHLVDFANGAATIKFDLSTLRTSFRDWIDIWVTPIEDNLVLPLNLLTVDLQGPPARGVQIKMDQFNGTVFRAFQFDNFHSRELASNSSQSLEKLLGGKASATTRTTFELTISSTRLTFGSLGYNWISSPLKNVNWTRAVVQLAHHSYNPSKDCTEQGLKTCLPNTWHWSNFSISSAVPYTLLRGDVESVHGKAQVVNFPAPAPASAFLRFAGIGAIDYSLDGGSTWLAAKRQAQLYNYAEHFSSYWTPIPAGTVKVSLRGHDWFAGPWWVRDITIWSATSPSSAATAPTQQPSSNLPGATAKPGTRAALRSSPVAALLSSPVVAASIVLLAVVLVITGTYLLLMRRRRARLHRD